MEEEPPRKVFQMLSASCWAWETEERPTDAEPPPREMVTILPLD